MNFTCYPNHLAHLLLLGQMGNDCAATTAWATQCLFQAVLCWKWGWVEPWGGAKGKSPLAPTAAPPASSPVLHMHEQAQSGQASHCCCHRQRGGKSSCSHSGSHSSSQVWLLERTAAVLGRKRCLHGGMTPLAEDVGRGEDCSWDEKDRSETQPAAHTEVILPRHAK